MNVSASKVLLGVSLAAYTYCSWDHMFAHDKPVTAPVKGQDLSAGMVNRIEVLALGGDPFESIRMERGEETGKPKGSPQLALGVLDDGKDKPLPPLNLQGVFMTPSGHVALINGKPIEVGEIAEVEAGKARIRARKIGEDFAVVEGAGQVIVLRLADPNAPKTDQASAGGGNNAAPQTNGARIGAPNYPSQRRKEMASGRD